MSARSTKRVQKGVKNVPAGIDSLEEEAKKFSSSKAKPQKTPKKEETLTPRQMLAGIILSGIISRSQGLIISRGDLKTEAYEWADLMLESE